MVGDAEGVVCVPRNIADDVARESYVQTIYETWVEERIEAGDSLFGTYPLTDDARRQQFAEWRNAHAARWPLADV